MTEELKPCPFCGGEAEYVKFKLAYGKARGQVRCVMKGCAGRAIGHHKDEKIAVEKWNTRA